MTTADLVELRLDSVAHPDVAGALADRQRPVIVTCRPTWEGGSFNGSEEARKRLLLAAVDLGAEFIDIEWRAGFSAVIARTRGRGIVLSSHDFDRMPVDLTERSRAMSATGAEVVKIAAAVHRVSDCLPFLSLAGGLAERQRHISIGMGEPGDMTRILASRFGSAWTYAGEIAGIGQLTTPTLLEHFRFRKITDSTEIYGVIGSGRSRLLFPAMLNAGFEAIDFNAVCVPLAVADIDDFAEFAQSVRLKGAAITRRRDGQFFDGVNPVDPTVGERHSFDTIRSVAGVWEGRNLEVVASMESWRSGSGGATIEALVTTTIELIRWWTGVVASRDPIRAALSRCLDQARLA